MNFTEQHPAEPLSAQRTSLELEQNQPDYPDAALSAWLSLANCLFPPAQLTRILAVIEHPLELFPDGQPGSSSHALPALLKRIGLARTNSKITIAERLARAIELNQRSWRWSESATHHLITLDSLHYPELLREIDDPPAVLFVSGDPRLLNQAQLAIVGSRRSTPAAMRICKSWAAELAKAGLVITSGLARGIDGSAHQGCLDAHGGTVAVMASGPDQCYPKQHRALYDAILEKGAVVTEFPPGFSPLPRNFPQRNRIISGLSLGTLVIEANLRSGTLVTARHAMEQNREVFAVPGSILNPESRGCHQLIQQGAKLVQQVSDIVEELSFELADTRSLTTGPTTSQSAQPSSETESSPPTVQPAHQQILDAAGFDPVNIDSLCAATGLAVKTLLPILLTLELEGMMQSLGDGRYIRC